MELRQPAKATNVDVAVETGRNAYRIFSSDNIVDATDIESLEHKIDFMSAVKLVEISENNALSDYKFRRAYAITLYVNLTGDESDEAITIGETLRDLALECLQDVECDVFFTAGPYTGSYIITIFGKGENPEDKTSFRARIKQFETKFAAKVKKLPWKETLLCAALIGQSATFWQHARESHPSKQPHAQTTILKAPEPVKSDLPGPWPFLIWAGEGAEALITASELLKRPERKRGRSSK
jgi:hypothetical protein